MWLLLIGLAIGDSLYLASNGHVIFLPLFVLLPLGWLFRRGKRGCGLTVSPVEASLDYSGG